MNLISDDYKAQMRELHAVRPDYGVAGLQHVGMVASLVRATAARSLLDYGAGKGRMIAKLAKSGQLPDGFTIEAYDPGIPEFATLPSRADLVTCIDVMEHIEQECEDAVLNHIASLTNYVVLFTISLVPASKTLPDGRNAHINLRPARYWVGKLVNLFDIFEATCHKGNELIFIGRSRNGDHRELRDAQDRDPAADEPHGSNG